MSKSDIETIIDNEPKHIRTLTLSKRFTVIEAVAFKNVFKSICESGLCPNTIILDFYNTQFIDSSGIGALSHSIKVSNLHNINLVALRINEQVLAVLHMTGLDQLLQIETKNSSHFANYQPSNVALPITHPSVQSKAKRMIDIVGSLSGLLITATLFIPIAIAIKMDSSGPLFFSQTRRGWMGKPFKLWKFRTMVADAEAQKHKVKNQAEGAIFKSSNDFRITNVGKFLRKTSLDEFPQFLNVLQGSMSLVGTRPPTLDEVEKYEIPQWRRLDVKPGISGEWQVNGRSSVKNFNDIIQLDLKYQKNWSHWYDIKLILKTITVIFSKQSGAM